jgi:hypothetical protein
MKTSFCSHGRLTLSAIALASLAACGGGGGAGAPVATPAPVVTPTPVPAPTPTPTPTPAPPDPAAPPPPVADLPFVPTWSFPPLSNPPPPAPAPSPSPAPTPMPTILFGTVAMAIAAEPACGFDAVNVTVTKLRFHTSAAAVAADAGWTEIVLQPARRINLARLDNGAIQSLASAALLPGHYAQTRLVLDANSNNDTTNSVVLAGSTAEVPLLTQAVAQDGIAVGPGFDIANGQNMTLIADVDACRSVVPNNGEQYLLRPVIKALPTVKNGINGFVATSLLGSHVRVTAQQNGGVVRATTPDPVTGEFILSRLDPGSYDIVITADERAASVIAAVPVASAVSVTPLNTAATPLILQAGASGRVLATLNLSPASAVEPAYGSASQKFASGPTVVIGYRVADLKLGAVDFRTPMVAPQLAVYSASSRLAFTAQPDVAPGIARYTVAATAPGYITRVTGTLSAVPQ